VAPERRKRNQCLDIEVQTDETRGANIADDLLRDGVKIKYISCICVSNDLCKAGVFRGLPVRGGGGVTLALQALLRFLSTPLLDFADCTLYT
jgi:hypothetical protein